MKKFLPNWGKGKQQQREERALAELRVEIAKNLEIFYVAQQLGQLRTFRLEAGRRVKDTAAAFLSDDVRGYLSRIQDFNNAIAAATDFEHWYSADIDHQNQDNARKLHDLKESAQEKFLGLEAVIKSAQSALIPLPRPPLAGGLPAGRQGKGEGPADQE